MSPWDMLRTVKIDKIMKKFLCASLILASISVAEGQKIVTLQQCYDSAAAATPLAREASVYSEISSLRDRNLAAAYLPVLDLNGSIVYNSDVPDPSALVGSLPIPPGTLPSIPHEQGRVTVDLTQTVWDGGVTRSARAVEQVIRELNMQQNEADIYRLHEQINNYYFSSMLLALQTDVTEIMIGELDARLKEAESGVKNGVTPPVTTDVLFAEKVKAMQSLTEMRYRHDALMSALAMITGIDDLRGATLLLPDQPSMTGEILNNPDLKIFDVRSKQLEMSKGLLKSQRMPRAFGFAQMGYGSPPGLNFFAETPDFYYSVGAGFKWNIWDWRKSSNERQSLTLQQQLTDIRKSAVVEGLERLLALKRAEIASLREAAKSDDLLISVRKKIVAVSASQLVNGTITGAQYITDLDSEKQAVINAGLRRINIARAEAEYINITGRK